MYHSQLDHRPLFSIDAMMEKVPDSRSFIESKRLNLNIHHVETKVRHGRGFFGGVT